MATGDGTFFLNEIDKFAKQIDISVADAVQKIVLSAWTQVTKISPVDTGRFRASWTISEGTPDTSVKPEGKYGRPSYPGIQLKSPYTIVWINNSLPYAVPLEYGHSRQAPTGIVRVAKANIEVFMQAIIRG